MMIDRDYDTNYRLAVALEIEDKQRKLDNLLDEQRRLIAETLLLCQRYIEKYDV